jgi:hypothetical protein
MGEFGQLSATDLSGHSYSYRYLLSFAAEFRPVGKTDNKMLMMQKQYLGPVHGLHAGEEALEGDELISPGVSARAPRIIRARPSAPLLRVRALCLRHAGRVVFRASWIYSKQLFFRRGGTVHVI